MSTTIHGAYKCHTCQDVVYSRARHDYRSCSCTRIAVDGGFDYTKFSWYDEIPQNVEPFDVDATKIELYDDWNYRTDRYGLIKGPHLDTWTFAIALHDIDDDAYSSPSNEQRLYVLPPTTKDKTLKSEILVDEFLRLKHEFLDGVSLENIKFDYPSSVAIQGKRLSIITIDC